MFSTNRSKASVTPLSNFVKHTSSGEKKKVYESVLKSASQIQNMVIEKSRKSASVCN